VGEEGADFGKTLGKEGLNVREGFSIKKATIVGGSDGVKKSLQYGEGRGDGALRKNTSH